jgi:choline dehydrogenase-like flavoprotein
MTEGGFDPDVVVIGTGFGGTMTALTLGRELKRRGRGENVLMLERGTWWTTPVETVADKTLAAPTTPTGTEGAGRFGHDPSYLVPNNRAGTMRIHPPPSAPPR